MVVMVFRAVVANTAWAGLAALVLSSREIQMIDGALMRYARVLMLGKATTWHEDGRVSTISNLKVWVSCECED